ncbi:hypothetical protein [Flavivirga jejuensis]
MEKLLPEKVAQIIPMLENALVDLFELHKNELAPMEYDISGISFDLIPSAYQTYSAISFRQDKDHKDSDTYVDDESLRYSPADWEYYSIFEHSNCKSVKFKEASEFVFKLFEELYESVEDYNGLQQDINHLILTAAATALLKPSVAAKLKECGILNAPTLDAEPDFCFEYIVKDEDRPFNFNYCEYVMATRATNQVINKLKL